MSDLAEALEGLNVALRVIDEQFGPAASVRFSKDQRFLEDDFGVHVDPILSVMVEGECGCRWYLELSGEGLDVTKTLTCRGDRPFVESDLLPSGVVPFESLAYEELPF